jgi:putative transposase
VQNLVHVAFSTKRTKLWGFMAGVCSKEKILPHEIGGMDGHAHLLIQLPPTWSCRTLFRKSRPVHLDGWEEFCLAAWFCCLQRQRVEQGRGGSLHRTQDAHHKKMDYKSELIALLQKHGVPYDPKYVFD